MKVVVKFDMDADIIECPKHVIDNLIEYRDKFTNWLFDKNNEHSYWWYKNGEKFGCSYRSTAFVEWLNNTILTDSIKKAKVLESCIINWDENLPSVSF